MNKTKKIIIGVVAAVLAVVIIIAGSVISTRNTLATQREAVDSAASNVDTYLQRRADLIPNLVATVKSYAEHETEVYENIAEARQKLINADTLEEKAEADSELTAALQGINVIVEAYPELKSDATYISLMDQLEGSENRIATARKDYNDAVQAYNSKLIKFPASVVANMFGFEKAEYFEAAEGAEDAPDVGELLGD